MTEVLAEGVAEAAPAWAVLCSSTRALSLLSTSHSLAIRPPAAMAEPLDTRLLVEEEAVDSATAPLVIRVCTPIAMVMAEQAPRVAHLGRPRLHAAIVARTNRARPALMLLAASATAPEAAGLVAWALISEETASSGAPDFKPR